MAFVLGDLPVLVGPRERGPQGREGGEEQGAFEDLVVAPRWMPAADAPRAVRADLPDLARVALETNAKGVPFLGIDVRGDKASAQAFSRCYDITDHGLLDPSDRQLVKFSSIISINAVSGIVVVDRKGQVAAGVIGRANDTTLSGLVQDVLAESPSEGLA